MRLPVGETADSRQVLVKANEMHRIEARLDDQRARVQPFRVTNHTMLLHAVRNCCGFNQGLHAEM